MCRVPILGEEFCVIRGVDREDKEAPLPFRFVRSHIALWLHDPHLWPVLLEMTNAVLGTDHPNPTLMGVGWLHQRIQDAFERGHLLLIDEEGEETEPKGGGDGAGSDDTTSPAGADRASPAPANAPPVEPPKEPVKTWFRARLLDEDGEPMTGEDYLLVDTDGVKRKGKLDAQGEVYIPPILPPGKCTISFPNIHLNPRKRK
jgi:hypothetical protein